MKKLHYYLFLLAYRFRRPLVLELFSLIKHDRFDIVKGNQSVRLVSLIDYAYNNIPYYKKLFDDLGLSPSDIKTIKDLEKLPILTKDIIKNNAELFKPVTGYSKASVAGSTGGSTGKPLKYALSNECYSLSQALLYKGWGKAGYELGDKVAIIAGGSLVGKERSAKAKFQDFLMNFRRFSSYGMDQELLEKYSKEITKFNPKFLRGYVTSIVTLAEYFEKRPAENVLKLRAIFTTAEMLSDKQREKIESVFGVKVFNTYGLNDGGISAYECHLHDGFHIDEERAILECVDENGRNVSGTEGKLLATALHNTDTVFIRYDTGDLGVVSDRKCKCGDTRKLLSSLQGRKTDSLTVNGKIIGSPVLTVLMGKVDVELYQIVQESENTLKLIIKKGTSYSLKDEEFITNSLMSHLGEINIFFDYTSGFKMASSGKHKFIVKMNHVQK